MRLTEINSLQDLINHWKYRIDKDPSSTWPQDIVGAVENWLEFDFKAFVKTHTLRAKDGTKLLRLSDLETKIFAESPEEWF